MVSYRWWLLIQEYFWPFETAEKEEFSKCSWYPKRKLGVTMHFSEKIKLLQYVKKKKERKKENAIH